MGASLALFALTLYWLRVDLDDLVTRLARMSPAFVALAFGVVFAQMALSALRWKAIAERMSAPIAFRTSTAEYYLAYLLNQVLPGGLAGDALRAARHARALANRTTEPVSRAAAAVLLERASGQIALWLIVLAAAPLWWSLLSAREYAAPLLGVLAAVVVVAVIVARLPAFRRGEHAIFRIWRDVRGAFLVPSRLGVHLGLSVAVVTTYLALFDVSARALGTPVSFRSLLAIYPWVLVAATTPVIFSGWGVREAAAAALYAAAGLPAAEGAAVGLTYGLLSLAGSAPGLVVLLWPAEPETAVLDLQAVPVQRRKP